MTDTTRTPDALLTALAAGDALDDVAGRLAASYAYDGESLAAFLEDLDQVIRAAELPAPSADLVRRCSVAWSDVALGRIAGLSCADALTGLSSVHHLQSVLTQLAHLRSPGDDQSYDLVVAELSHGDDGPEVPVAMGGLSTALRTWILAEELHEVYGDEGVLASLSPWRCAALLRSAGRDGAQRVEDLQRRVQRRLLLVPSTATVRVWSQALPADVATARATVAALAAERPTA